jgi:hypothetical protein
MLKFSFVSDFPICLSNPKYKLTEIYHENLIVLWSCDQIGKSAKINSHVTKTVWVWNVTTLSRAKKKGKIVNDQNKNSIYILMKNMCKTQNSYKKFIMASVLFVCLIQNTNWQKFIMRTWLYCDHVIIKIYIITILYKWPIILVWRKINPTESGRNVQIILLKCWKLVKWSYSIQIHFSSIMIKSDREWFWCTMSNHWYRAGTSPKKVVK